MGKVIDICRYRDANIKIDIRKLEKMTGIRNISPQDLLFYVQGMLYFLNTHDKNFTEEQNQKIELLYNILDCIEIQEEKI